MDLSSPEIDVLGMLSSQMADAIERVGPALVQVNGRQRQPASGVVYAPDTILTADHVLEREEDLTVGTHDGRSLAAQFVGRDPASDLAVLRVPLLGLTPAAAAGPARVGQLVLAVGRPSGESPLASLGIVSAVGGPLRSQRGALLEQYIRTDATPYPGFSGGPLIDSRGAVVGILTTGLVGGVPLAVPAGIAWQIAQTLEQHGVIKRGFLGISCQPVPLPASLRGDTAQESALLLVRVEEDSPAAAAGLLLGDLLTALDGQPVADTDDLQALLGGDRVGRALTAEVVRGGVRQTLQVTVGQRG